MDRTPLWAVPVTAHKQHPQRAQQRRFLMMISTTSPKSKGAKRCGERYTIMEVSHPPVCPGSCYCTPRVTIFFANADNAPQGDRNKSVLSCARETSSADVPFLTNTAALLQNARRKGGDISNYARTSASPPTREAWNVYANMYTLCIQQRGKQKDKGNPGEDTQECARFLGVHRKECQNIQDKVKTFVRQSRK